MRKIDIPAGALYIDEPGPYDPPPAVGMKVIVIASSRDMAYQWGRDHRVDVRNLIVITSPHDLRYLRGRRGDPHVFAPGWKYLTVFDVEQITAELKVIESSPLVTE